MNASLKSKPLKAFFVGMCFFALASCSSIFAKEGTPESKRAVLLVANEYLTAVLVGKTQKLSDVVAWGEYFENNEGLTKETIESEILLAKKRFPLAEHPISDLIPVSVDVRGDNAVVTLRKNNKPESPLIIINAYWAAGGWIVRDDNLFGAEGVITNALSNPKG